MTFRVQWHLVCDQCKQQSEQCSDDIHTTEAKCIDAGWQCASRAYKTHHLCPACVASGVVPKWWPKQEEQ